MDTRRVKKRPDPVRLILIWVSIVVLTVIVIGAIASGGEFTHLQLRSATGILMLWIGGGVAAFGLFRLVRCAVSELPLSAYLPGGVLMIAGLTFASLDGIALLALAAILVAILMRPRFVLPPPRDEWAES
jgi:hypothetical protein